MLYQDDISRARDIGMYVQHYGQSWPAIVPLLLDLYKTRFAQLPFIPIDWFDKVEAEHGQGDVILLPMNSKNWLGGTVANIPDWLDTQARIDAWSTLYNTVNDAVSKFATNELAAGELAVWTAQANATFWNDIYASTKAISDAIAPYNPLKSGSAMQNALIYGGVAVGALALIMMFRK